jgi:hypothetical protein
MRVFVSVYVSTVFLKKKKIGLAGCVHVCNRITCITLRNTYGCVHLLRQVTGYAPFHCFVIFW